MAGKEILNAFRAALQTPSTLASSDSRAGISEQVETIRNHVQQVLGGTTASSSSTTTTPVGGEAMILFGPHLQQFQVEIEYLWESHRSELLEDPVRLCGFLACFRAVLPFYDGPAFVDRCLESAGKGPSPETRFLSECLFHPNAEVVREAGQTVLAMLRQELQRRSSAVLSEYVLSQYHAAATSTSLPDPWNPILEEFGKKSAEARLQLVKGTRPWLPSSQHILALLGKLCTWTEPDSAVFPKVTQQSPGILFSTARDLRALIMNATLQSTCIAEVTVFLQLLPHVLQEWSLQGSACSHELLALMGHLLTHLHEKQEASQVFIEDPSSSQTIYDLTRLSDRVYEYFGFLYFLFPNTLLEYLRSYLAAKEERAELERLVVSILERYRCVGALLTETTSTMAAEQELASVPNRLADVSPDTLRDAVLQLQIDTHTNHQDSSAPPPNVQDFQAMQELVHKGITDPLLLELAFAQQQRHAAFHHLRTLHRQLATLSTERPNHHFTLYQRYLQQRTQLQHLQESIDRERVDFQQIKGKYTTWERELNGKLRALREEQRLLQAEKLQWAVEKEQLERDLRDAKKQLEKVEWTLAESKVP